LTRNFIVRATTGHFYGGHCFRSRRVARQAPPQSVYKSKHWDCTLQDLRGDGRARAPTFARLNAGHGTLWVWLNCPIALAPLIIRWRPDVSSDVLRRSKSRRSLRQIDTINLRQDCPVASSRDDIVVEDLPVVDLRLRPQRSLDVLLEVTLDGAADGRGRCRGLLGGPTLGLGAALLPGSIFGANLGLDRLGVGDVGTLSTSPSVILIRLSRGRTQTTPDMWPVAQTVRYNAGQCRTRYRSRPVFGGRIPFRRVISLTYFDATFSLLGVNPARRRVYGTG